MDSYEIIGFQMWGCWWDSHEMKCSWITLMGYISCWTFMGLWTSDYLEVSKEQGIPQIIQNHPKLHHFGIETVWQDNQPRTTNTANTCFLEPKQHGMVPLWYVQFMIQVKNTPRRPVVLTESGRRPRRWCNEPKRGKIRHHCTCTTVCCISRMQKSKWVRTDAYVLGSGGNKGLGSAKANRPGFHRGLGALPLQT